MKTGVRNEIHRVIVIFLLFTQFCFSQLDKSESETLKSEKSNYLTKDELLLKANEFFKVYIPERLSVLDEEGYATEYEKAREYHIGDINLDGIHDIIIIYTVEGIGGGNNWSRHISIMISDGEKISGYQDVLVYGKFQSKSEFLGIKGGYALFKRYELEFGGSQTKWKKIGFGIRSEKLVEIEIPD